LRIALTLDRDASKAETNDYLHSLVAAGFSRDEIQVLGPEAAASLRTGDYDGVVLGGGCDVEPERYGETARAGAGVSVDPERDELDFSLYARARREGTPVLAICRGLQVVQVAHGGRLVQDLPTERPSPLVHDTPKGAPTRREHEVSVVRGTRLADLAKEGSLPVNSRHHQAVDVPAAGLVASATSPDGLVEAFEAPEEDRWMIGVQWHPENLAAAGDEPSRRLFADFARAVRARIARSPARPTASGGTGVDAPAETGT
jgi:putative glutamine amidotransferase